MVKFYLEQINEQTVIISAIGDCSDIIMPVIQGNGWPYILTFDEILEMEHSENHAQLSYFSNFYNSDWNNQNFIPVGYHNFISTAVGQIPPLMPEGSLRFTGLPYIQSDEDLSHTNLIIPGYFGGTVQLIHPNIAAYIKNVGSIGNVYWGPKSSHIEVESQAIIGEWKIIDAFQ